MVFVGLDCGGSSTRVLAVDEKGTAVFRGQSGPANLLSTPKSAILQSLRAATNNCPPPASVCGCFAGLVSDASRKQAQSYLKSVFPGAKKIRTEPDFVAALAACGPTTDVCVIAGTGSIVCSWQDSVAVKSGGRGPLLGDPGSAAQIGRRFLSAYLDDPSAASAKMKRYLNEIFESSEEREVIVNLYGSPSPPAALAKLGKAVAAESLAGSVAAGEIVRTEMAALSRLLQKHVRSFGGARTSYRVGLAGGLWKCSPIYKEAFHRALETETPEMTFDLFILRRPPVEGAVSLAKEAIS